MIDGVLGRVVSPEPLTILAQGWPSFLISALAMELPIAGAYFPASFHHYFDKTKSGDLTWYTPDDFKPSLINGTFLASGSLSYLKCIYQQCQPASAILCVEHKLRGQNPRGLHRLHHEARVAFSDMGLHAFVFQHAAFGGDTSASHVIGFSSSLLDLVDGQIDLKPREVPRALSHFLNSATRDTPARCKWIDVPSNKSLYPTSKVSWLDKECLLYSKDGSPSHLKRQKWKSVLDCNGLLPAHDPGSVVATPSVFGPPNKLCVRPVTVPEPDSTDLLHPSVHGFVFCE